MPRTTRRSAATLATLAGIAAAGTLAFGASSSSVNLPVRGKDTIKGTLRPAFDEENFLCDVPRGASFAVSLKGKSPNGPVFQPALLDDGGPAAGATFVTKGRTISLAPGFAAAASGRLRVQIRGDFDRDGDYELKIAWKSKAAWSATGGPLAATATDSFTFGAPAGANAVIDVRPASHSAFSGTIVGVTGPDGALAVPPGTTSHLVLPRVASTGDYTVQFRNDGASDGSWTAKAKLKLPRVPADRIDIRDARLTGAFGGDHTVYGSVIGPTGGSLEISATFGPLDGSSVSIPSGVLPGPTILTVSAAPPLSTGGGNHPAGPAVEFGPPGTTFDPSGSDPSKQATITVPFDPSYFPSGTDSLVIFVRSSSGVVSEVPRPYVFGANTVSFTTSHFSSYQAATADPRPLSGNFAALEVRFDELPNYEGQFGFGNHSLTADAAGTTLDTKKSVVRWIDGLTAGPSAVMDQNIKTTSLNVTVNDDHSLTTVDPSDPTGPIKFRRGASDDVLVGTGSPIVLLRRAGARATVATVAGKWHFFHQQMGTRTTSAQPPEMNLEFVADSGVLNLLADGTVQVAPVRGFDASTPYPTGTWQHKAEGQVPPGVSWDLLDDGSVSLHSPDSSYPVIFNTVLGGDVLVGFGVGFGGQSDEGPASELFVLVRASTDAKLSQVAGDYFTVGAETETVDAKTSGQGFDFRVSTLTVTIAANGNVLIAGTEDQYSHDGQGLPFEQPAQPLAGPSGRITLKPDGSFTSTDGSFGAFSRRGDLFVRSVSDGTQFSLVFGTPLVLKSH